MRTSRFVTAVFGLVAAFFLRAHDPRANACVWNGTSGDWTDVARWSSCGGTFPGAADSASISGGTVTLSSNQSVTGLTLSGGSGRRATKDGGRCLTVRTSPEEPS